MADFMQIDAPAYASGPILIGLSNLRFARATSSTTIHIYYTGDADFTELIFSTADASYTLHRWFFAQMVAARDYVGSAYSLPPIIPLGAIDVITFSTINP